MISLNNIQDGSTNTISLPETNISDLIKTRGDLVKIDADLVSRPFRPIVDRFPGSLIDLPIATFPKLPVAPADFESNYGGLIDAINTLSDQINDKKAALEDPNLSPEQRMQLAIELQELMQMRLQMITITTNLLKTEHDSNQAINNNLRG